jgi:ABC-type polar amino acid transport system ATPase subunit
MVVFQNFYVFPNGHIFQNLSFPNDHILKNSFFPNGHIFKNLSFPNNPVILHTKLGPRATMLS